MPFHQEEQASKTMLWWMTQVVRGSYTIVNVNSGMQLTVSGPTGTQVVQIPGGSYGSTEMFKLTLAQ